MHRYTARTSLSRVAPILFLALLISALIPAPPSYASVEYPLPIDNTDNEFGDIGSTLQVTSLVAQTGEPTEELGGVQLSPIGKLDWQQPGNGLDVPTSGAGAAVIGSYIFVVGGQTGATYLNNVARGQVDRTSGLITWSDALTLTAVPHYGNGPLWIYSQTNLGALAPKAERSEAAVTSYVPDPANKPNDGFIYVIGGKVLVNSYDYSSASVEIGVVVNGVLTEWRRGGPTGLLPTVYGVGTAGRGVRAASAVTVNTGSKTFLYVIGGQQRLPSSSATFASKRIVVAQLDRSTGAITWVSTSGDPTTFADLPIAGTSGLWASAAVAGDFASAATGAVQTAIFIMGGRTDDAGTPPNPKATNTVYKAIVDTNTGLVTIPPGSAGPGADGTMIDQRNFHGAVLYGGVIYVAGGKAGLNPPEGQIVSSSSPIDGEQSLSTYGQANFAATVDDSPIVAQSRAQAPVVVVPAADPAQAFVYLIGGFNTTDQASVLRATIGSTQNSQPIFAEEGWYTAKPVSIILDGQQTKVKRLSWIAKMPTDSAGNKLEIQYRVSNDPNCDDLRRSTAAWVGPAGADPLDGYLSVDGANTLSVDQGQLNANCFQYRARFIRGANQNSTSALLRFAIDVLRPGSADLKFPSSTPIGFDRTPTNIVTGVNVTIKNENLFEPPTLNAAYGLGGTFYVDLFIYPPGVEPPSPHPAPPFPNGSQAVSQYHIGYIEVRRNLLEANTTYTIPSGAVWCNAQITTSCQPIDLSTKLTERGIYKLVAVVDSIDNVLETAEGDANPQAAEQNNVSAVVTLDLTTSVGPTPDRRVFFPAVGTQGRSS